MSKYGTHTDQVPDLSDLLSFVPVDQIDTDAELARLDAREAVYNMLNVTYKPDRRGHWTRCNG